MEERRKNKITSENKKTKDKVHFLFILLSMAYKWIYIILFRVVFCEKEKKTTSTFQCKRNFIISCSHHKLFNEKSVWYTLFNVHKWHISTDVNTARIKCAATTNSMSNVYFVWTKKICLFHVFLFHEIKWMLLVVKTDLVLHLVNIV